MVEFPSNWQDDLIWCPSQLYLEIEIDNKKYVIYCRWRHSDPWTVELVTPDFEWWSGNLCEGEELIRETPIELIHERAIGMVTKYLNKRGIQ